MKTDTIVAIVTAISSSGIGIIRISGEQVFSVLQEIFRTKQGKKLDKTVSHRVHYGHIYDGNEMIDEVLALVMGGSHSYTAEDTAEIDCHGGVLVMKKILGTVIKYGVRSAEPGEFTKRAFLNGRIDLPQAEVVIGVINAKNQYALKSLVSQLAGSVSDKIKRLREQIIYETVSIESALDDPEYTSLDGHGEKLLSNLEPMIQEMEKLVSPVDNGRVITEGVRTVILGRPNAGKPSLMNVLVGEEWAIVTDVTGTTRDTLEEHIRLQGIDSNTIDAAGIRETEDAVEKIGALKARNMADEADLIIFVMDASVSPDENDEEIIELIRNKKAAVLLNKTDLEMMVTKEYLEEKTGHMVTPVSAREETGIGLLEQEIKSMFYQGEIDFNDEVTIANVRHKTTLVEALASLRMVRQSVCNGTSEDFYPIDSMNVYEVLGSVVGEAVEESLVNEIFGKFCTGR